MRAKTRGEGWGLRKRQQGLKLGRFSAASGFRMPSSCQPYTHRALGRGALQSSSQGVAACQPRFLPKLSSRDQSSSPRRGASPPPAGSCCGRGSHHVPPGSYLSGVHFGVLRRCTAAQAIQKHQKQREQPSSVAEAASSAARPSRRAPVAAHARRPPTGP